MVLGARLHPSDPWTAAGREGSALAGTCLWRISRSCAGHGEQRSDVTSGRWRHGLGIALGGAQHWGAQLWGAAVHGAVQGCMLQNDGRSCIVEGGIAVYTGIHTAIEGEGIFVWTDRSRTVPLMQVLLIIMGIVLLYVLFILVHLLPLDPVLGAKKRLQMAPAALRRHCMPMSAPSWECCNILEYML